ncbi:asparagine--tRNA ligase [Clostridium sp. 'deep sea']|uniref:asparagine--tRNA ligase n=1 Tax=Clostridium sp. 'deep sea' TaxID=2779445 RepID=UPI0018969546|nr:asparagine--tRNA ligase [Clostridium sp. 'deep sea']QOR33910.1 asparagine--tRNA ligase [Clostridium sp. 'deep sea']
MQDFTLIKQLFRNSESFSDKEIIVTGWVRSNRASNKFGFLAINDGSFFNALQVVYEEELSNFKDACKFNIGTALIIKGKLVLTPNAKQPFELKASEIIVEGESTPDFPLQKKRHSFEYLRSIAHLRPRTNTFAAVNRVRSEAAFALHKFFNDRGFVYVHTPIITGSDCEGAGEMFRVTTLNLSDIPKDEQGKVDYNKDFFGKETFLTVSGQLNVEGFAQSLRNVYTFGPTFRSENSNTSRHASEFWMIEPEMAFADINDNMRVGEAMMKSLITDIINKCPEEMQFFNKFVDKGLLSRLENIVNSDFACITYTEAIELLEKAPVKFEFPVKWGIDLQSEHERYITEKVFKKPVYVINYPKEIKAFYMRLNDDNKTVGAMDLLVPGIGEIIGGSERENRYDVLLRRIKEMDLNEEDYSFYLDLRKYGSTRHSGYGLGFERAIMYLTGMSNIRDVLPYPRTPRNAQF